MTPRWSMVGLSLVVGCFSGGDLLVGLAEKNPADAGPAIVWDLDATPLPEVPFPNNVATRADASADTGRRVNVSAEAVTRHESRLRELINLLDGFGTYSPIWVRFAERIDLLALHQAQNDDDPANDAVYLVNIDRNSPNYGQMMPLDFDSGRFPYLLDDPGRYFLNDPRAEASNLLFETYDEDLNGNGILDPGEDTDGDGVLDRPNLWGTVLGQSDRLNPYGDLITFYELETDTLTFRPILPLDEGTTYAVILTRRIVGETSQSPIRPPASFSFINHVQQTPELRPLLEDRLLDGLGIQLADVAFTWSFTTQTIVKPLQTIRAGLWGVGPLARLADEFPPVLTRVAQPDTAEYTANVYTLDMQRITDAFEQLNLLTFLGQEPSAAEPLVQSYRDHVDYIVFVEFESPAFIENDDGALFLDWNTGKTQYGRETIYMACTVPQPDKGSGPPFPVVLDAHGTGTTRLQFLGYGGYYAAFGFATCAIDAYGHGLPSVIAPFAQLILGPANLDLLAEILSEGRAKDVNNNGFADSGGDFWTANIVHTRDVVRQTVIDHYQTLRVLLNFGKGPMPADVHGDGAQALAGDFNGDGIVDFGGENVEYYLTGQSLGGIVATVVGATEPALSGVSPVAAGAGLTDITARSDLPQVVAAVYGPVMGTMIVGREVGSQGTIQLAFNAQDVFITRLIPFGTVPDLSASHTERMEVGDRVRVTNLDNGAIDETMLFAPEPGRAPGAFRLQIATDRFDRLELAFFRAGSSTPYRVINQFEREVEFFEGNAYAVGDPLVAFQDGFGLKRGTPAMRRLFGVAQTVVDAADPANFVRLYGAPEAMPPHAAKPMPLLIHNSTGDMTVPINTGVALARIAGLLPMDERLEVYDRRSRDQFLLDTWVVEGLPKLQHFATDPCYYDPREILFDPDELSEGLDANQGPHPSTIVVNPVCSEEEPPEACDTMCSPKPPLRTGVSASWGQVGARFIYVDNQGFHGVRIPETGLDFDYHMFSINQRGWFFRTQGQQIVDDVCMADVQNGCPLW